jgi:RNA polymerase sigma-70 factor (ECF subfamily)
MNEIDLVRTLPVAPASDPTERLAVLFDAHYERLYRLARRLTASTDDALDLVQETFLKAAKSPKSIPFGLGNEEAWLVRVLINTRHDHWRKTSTRNRHDATAFADCHLTSEVPDAEASLIAKNAVWQALDVLPPRRRAIVVMHELEGLAISVIASLLGISAVTVRWHLSKGRRDLIHALKPCIGDTK